MLLDHFARRRAEPVDDLASFLVTSELRIPEGEVRTMTDREAMHHARLDMVTGGGTTQLGAMRHFGLAGTVGLASSAQLSSPAPSTGMQTPEM